MDKKKKGLLIFISILITGIILFRFFIGFDKNNELNGDYYLYFKFPNQNNYIGESEINTLYRFKDGVINSIDKMGTVDEYRKYSMIDNDNVEFTGITNGGSIRKQNVKIIRENGKVTRLYLVEEGNKLNEIVEEVFVKHSELVNPVSDVRKVGEVNHNSNFIGQQIILGGDFLNGNINFQTGELSRFGLLYQSGNYEQSILTDISLLKPNEQSKISNCYVNHVCLVNFQGSINENTDTKSNNISPLKFTISKVVYIRPLYLDK